MICMVSQQCGDSTVVTDPNAVWVFLVRRRSLCSDKSKIFSCFIANATHRKLQVQELGSPRQRAA